MLPILFATNHFDGLLITTLSLVKWTKTPIHYYIMTMSLPDLNPKYQALPQEKAAYLEGILREANAESRVSLFDLSASFRAELGNSVNLGNHFSPYPMLRLFADKVDGLPDKVIYLDTDIVMNRDLNLLYEVDVAGYELAGVRDIYRLDRTYFNAGVLLLNMEELRRTDALSRARGFCNTRRMLYMDQTALNLSVKKVKYLPRIFNSMDRYYPEIICHHFCNLRKCFFHRIKPWEINLVKEKFHVYDDILDDFQRRKAILE